MKKLLIIDGHNLLFQMFYGMPSRIVNADGIAIHGTIGFVGAFIKIIKMTNPTHIVVIFDGEHKNERTELSAEYKENRTDYSQAAEENNPFSQLDDIYKALDFMGVKYTEVQELEADDFIAGYANSCKNQMQVVISSFDSDFFQLINDNVKVLRYRGKNTVICDKSYIQKNLQIAPQQYADFKSLTGDPADNIKGAERIGPKIAAQLLNCFGNLESVIINAEQITKPSIRESVLRNADRLRNNYRLIKLDNRVKLPFAINKLKYKYNGITTMEVLKGICLK